MTDRATAYILGEMSEEEQIRFEEEYFSDEEKLQTLKAARDELMDSYTRGRLTPRQREQFEKHCLASPWQQQRLPFSAVMTEYVDSQPVVTAPADTWRERLRARLLWPRPIPAYAFAILFLLVIASGALVVRELIRLRAQIEQLRVEQRNTQQPVSEMEEELTRTRAMLEQLIRSFVDSGDDEPVAPAAITFALSPKTFPEGSVKRLVVPRAVATIEFIVAASTANKYRSLRTQLFSADGKLVVEQDGLALTVPASSLADGDYQIKLTSASTHLYSYSFRLQKK